jgi:glycosyltransferase involved in cell wall biosynthesis
VRILMLTQFYAPVVGGEERIVEDLSVELVRRGHDVAVATLRESSAGRFDVRDGVRVHRLASSAHRASWLFSQERRHAPPMPDPETVLDLRRVLKRERPEIVHAHNWLVYSFLPLRSRTDAALVLSLHDYSLACATKRLFRFGEPCSGPGPIKCVICAAAHYGVTKGTATAIGNRVMSAIGRGGVDLFLPVSRAVAEGNGLTGQQNHQVIPNFIRAVQGKESEDDDPRLMRLPDGEFLLFVGDLTTDKGVEVLLEAHHGLRNAPPLVLIGRPHLQHLVQSAPNVLALGTLPHDSVTKAWRRCAIAIVPSIWREPFGLVALEASAAGIPVVASDTGGLPDIIVHGQNGLLVPPADPVALRNALQTLLDDPDLRKRMGVAGRLRSALFMADAVVPQIENAYKAVLRKKAG